MLSQVRQPAAYRKPSAIERAMAVLHPPPFGASDNHANANSFLAGKGWLIGDVVELRRGLVSSRRGEIVSLVNLDSRAGGTYRSKFFTQLVLVEWEGGDAYVAPRQVTLVDRPRSYRKHFQSIYMSQDAVAFRRGQVAKSATNDLAGSGFPEWSIKDDLHDGVVSLCLANDEAQAASFFERVETKADFVARRARPDRPESRAQISICRSLAQAVSGGALDQAELLHASAGLEEYCAAITSGYWGELAKSAYILAVLASLLASDAARARELLKTRTSFADFEDLRAVVKGLARKGAATATDPTFDSYSSACFDLVRHPYFFFHRDISHPRLIALLLSAVLEKRRRKRGADLCWPHIAAAVYR